MLCLLLCVQEVAELKEEDLPSDTATAQCYHLHLMMLHVHGSSDTITPHTATTPGPVMSVNSTELPDLPSLLPTAAAGVSGDLSRTLSKSTGLLALSTAPVIPMFKRLVSLLIC